MEIIIKTGDWRDHVEFTITGIHYSLDEKGYPIDIVVYGTEDILEAIAEFAWGDGNMQPLTDFYPEDIRMKNLGATHEVLFARLNEFEVL